MKEKQKIKGRRKTGKEKNNQKRKGEKKPRETITREMNRKGIFFLPKFFSGLETR
jgi:hypothetical protein